jgi:RNA polymerase sigma factor (TIGR02999 family)
MDESSRSKDTQIFLDLQMERITGAEATDRVFGLVYEELRRLAAALMRGERANHTLQATALVHALYCRLIDETRIEWQSRAHFFGVAARAMRQILVDHARQRARAKRGGGWQRVTLDDRLESRAVSETEILRLDNALNRLAELDERMARVVELRAFGGLSAEDAAQVLGVTSRTIQSDWRMAEMWLARELDEGGQP